MLLTEEQEEKILLMAQGLIRIPETSGKEADSASYVACQMADLGYDGVQTDEYGTVIGIVRGSQSGPTVLFDGHLDVVPVAASETWDHEPFGGERAEGKIWGRGALDVKGTLAAMLCAPAFAAREGFAGAAIVCASVAEEVLPGAALSEVLETHPADAVVIGEPTGLKPGLAEKGRAGIEMTTLGQPGHTSQPDAGDNAVYRMLEAISCIREMPRRCHPFLGEEVIELVEIGSDPMSGWSIPHRCRTRWLCRLLADETKESYLARWKDALGGMEAVELRYAATQVDCYTGAVLKGIDFHSGWIAPREEPFHQAVKMALEVNGVDPVPYAVPFACNAYASAGVRDIPTVVLGPGDVAGAHRPNESLAIAELLLAARVYATLLVKLSPLA